MQPSPERSDQPQDAATVLEELTRQVTRLGPLRELSLSALGTLATLAVSGPLAVTDLAGREQISQPSMTTLLFRLQRHGLVHRQRDPADGRVVLVAITDAGRRTLHRRRSSRIQFLTDLVARLTPAERRALLEAVPALRAMTQALTELALPGRDARDARRPTSLKDGVQTNA